MSCLFAGRVPALAGGIPPLDCGSTYLCQVGSYLCLGDVPTLEGGTYLGQFIPRAVRLLWLSAGEISCFHIVWKKRHTAKWMTWRASVKFGNFQVVCGIPSAGAETINSKFTRIWMINYLMKFQILNGLRNWASWKKACSTSIHSARYSYRQWTRRCPEKIVFSSCRQGEARVSASIYQLSSHKVTLMFLVLETTIARYFNPLSHFIPQTKSISVYHSRLRVNSYFTY